MSNPAPEQQPGGEPSKVSALEEASQAYNAFNRFVAFRDDDSTLVMAGKLLLRFLGIFIMILLSPFLLIGLAIAFAAVL